MWTVKTILLPLAVVIAAALALIALVIVPIILPEARPFYRKALGLVRTEIKRFAGIRG